MSELIYIQKEKKINFVIQVPINSASQEIIAMEKVYSCISYLGILVVKNVVVLKMKGEASDRKTTNNPYFEFLGVSPF